MCRMTKTYNRGRLRLQDLVDLLQHLRCQLRNDQESLQILRDLCGSGSSKDDGRSVGFDGNPCEGKVSDSASQFCASQNEYIVIELRGATYRSLQTC